jgi:hypothetical protein
VQPTTSAAVPDDLRYLRRVYENLATIQRFAGATFGPPPEETTYEEAYDLAWLAQALVAGGYNAATSKSATHCALVCSGASFRFAQQHVKLPLMTIKHATRIRGPEPLWEVELLPPSGDNAPVRYRLTPLDRSAARRGMGDRASGRSSVGVPALSPMRLRPWGSHCSHTDEA